MRKRFLCRSAAVCALLLTVPSLNGQEISKILQLTMTLSKRQLQLGDELVGHFAITNVSDTNALIIPTGSLYMAYWFSVEGPKGPVLADPLFEKLFTSEISPEDLVTLTPGQSFTLDRNATVVHSQGEASKVFIDFGDSGFHLDCGEQYQISGVFWAREDRSGQFKVLSGRLKSAPVPLWVAPCK